MHSASNDKPLTMLIRKLESIAPLSDEEREAIHGLPTKIRTLQAGQNIVHEGDKPSQCCLIVEGWACRFKILGEGRRQIFSFHIPGDTPDLQSLHLHTMDHSLATITEATVVLIPHDRMMDLTMRFPRVGALLWRDTLIDAAIFREWMAGIGRKSAFGRIAHLFCEMYVKLGGGRSCGRQPLSLADHASRTRRCAGPHDRSCEPNPTGNAGPGPDHPAGQHPRRPCLEGAVPVLRVRSRLPPSRKDRLKDESTPPACAGCDRQQRHGKPSGFCRWLPRSDPRATL